MSQISPPKFKFVLYLDNSKTYINKGQQQVQDIAPSSVVCFADTFDVTSDGSIVFYQTIATGDKKFKVPVLSYPNGKWHGCVLLDDSNEFPVFKGTRKNYYNHNQNHQPLPTGEASIPNSNSSDNNDGNSDDLSQLSDSFGSSSENSNNPNPNANPNNSGYQNTPGQAQYHPNQGMPNQPFPNNNNGLGMPGIITGSNPQEFKKQKDDWLENEVKQYAKDITLFTINEFLTYITKKPQNKTYKTTETDIIWACSKLIRSKAIISRKFAEPNVQKILALILPDIMKRQWEGKMAPILQILQEREETKNTTAIDLAVWMVQNNY